MLPRPRVSAVRYPRYLPMHLIYPGTQIDMGGLEPWRGVEGGGWERPTASGRIQVSRYLSNEPSTIYTLGCQATFLIRNAQPITPPTPSTPPPGPQIFLLEKGEKRNKEKDNTAQRLQSDRSQATLAQNGKSSAGPRAEASSGHTNPTHSPPACPPDVRCNCFPLLHFRACFFFFFFLPFFFHAYLLGE